MHYEHIVRIKFGLRPKFGFKLECETERRY